MENNNWEHKFYYSPATKMEYYNWCMSQREIKLLYLCGFYWFLKPVKIYFRLKEFFITRTNNQKFILYSILLLVFLRVIEIIFFNGTIF